MDDRKTGVLKTMGAVRVPERNPNPAATTTRIRKNATLFNSDFFHSKTTDE